MVFRTSCAAAANTTNTNGTTAVNKATIALSPFTLPAFALKVADGRPAMSGEPDRVFSRSCAGADSRRGRVAGVSDGADLAHRSPRSLPPKERLALLSYETRPRAVEGPYPT